MLAVTVTLGENVKDESVQTFCQTVLPPHAVTTNCAARLITIVGFEHKARRGHTGNNSCFSLFSFSL